MTSHILTRVARGERGLVYVAPAPLKPAQDTTPRFADFGNLMRNLRIAAGMQQAVLASLARVPQSSVSRIEHGRRHPRIDTLLALTQALALSGDLTADVLKAAGYEPAAAARGSA